jgi:DNA polymerase-3 subunit gamma/tau
LENFVVSARKYRPATFDQVVGQKSITATLKNAIGRNQLAQAFLFCGPRGVGKTTCARILAKTINCENLNENLEPCNRCESCRSFADSASFNIHELDAASNNSVDDIRVLVDQVRIPPQVGRYKVYIIDEVHMLSPAAFNAFLKTLEEPPAYAKFILATTEKHKIIPTILSRCQIYDFKRITVEDTAAHLARVAQSEGANAEPEALHVIARKSDGALRDALSIFDQMVSFAGKNFTYKHVIENLNILDEDYYFRITDAILQADPQSTLLIINEIIDNGFDGQHFLIGFGQHLRSLLVCKDPVTLKLLEASQGSREKYGEQAGKCPADFLLKSLDLANRCDLNYKVSNNKRLHLEIALLQMCRLMAPQAPEPGNGKTMHPSGKSAPTARETVKPATVRRETSSTGESKGKQAAAKQASAGSKPGTISIKSPPQQETSASVAAESPAGYAASEPFSQEQLTKAWQEFIAPGGNNQFLITAIENHIPVVKENFNLDLTVAHKGFYDELNLNKAALLRHLQERLKNHRITLTVSIAESPAQDKPYTTPEKFKKMAEQNPSLFNLKDELGLEIEP